MFGYWYSNLLSIVQRRKMRSGLGPLATVPVYAMFSLFTLGLSFRGAGHMLSVSRGNLIMAPSLEETLTALFFLLTTLCPCALSTVSLYDAVWTRKLSMAQHADKRFVLHALAIPAYNIAGCLALPSFLVSKDWPMYLAFLQMLGGAVRLPPMHAFTSWIILTSVFGWVAA